MTEINWDPTASNESLEVMVHRMSQYAEQVFEDGDFRNFTVLWWIDAPGKGQATLVTPMGAKDAEQERVVKRAVHEAMRKHFAEWGVSRFVSAFEAWGSSGERWQGAPVDDPQRREGVIIYAEDGRKSLTAMRLIHRPPQGKPYLAKLEITPGGRAVDLLEGMLPTLQ
jgi:hypothetical protein